MTLKIAILGSGASAFATALAVNEHFKEKHRESIKIDVLTSGDVSFNIGAQNAELQRSSNNPLEVAVRPLSAHWGFDSQLFGSLGGSDTFGGWTSIWGATIQQPSYETLASWRKQSIDIGASLYWLRTSLPHFRDLGTVEDPNNIQSTRTNRVLPPWVQDQKTFQDLKRTVSLGPSRLAISKLSSDQNTGCNQCGGCLTGCPSDHIWSARDAWRSFADSGMFKFLSDVFIVRVEERRGGVDVHTTSNSSPGNLQVSKYDRCFIALGSLQTAALLLRSEIATEPVCVRESQLVITPFVRKSGLPTGDFQPRISLSDAFLLGKSHSNSDPRQEHFSQIYCASPMLDEKLRKFSRTYRFLPNRFRLSTTSRLGFAMSFMDQELSNSIMVYRHGARITASGSMRHKTESRLIRQLILKDLSLVGLFPLMALSRFVATGLSYHLGSSFSPVENCRISGNSSDLLGRPNSTTRIHLVDSSVLPRITPTPTTLATMANAIRIGKGVCEDL